MANTKQAAKRAKQTAKSRSANMGLRTTLRTAIKKAREAIATGDTAAARPLVDAASQALARAASKGLIHSRNAARTTSTAASDEWATSARAAANA